MKNIKIILLSFSLAASLAVTSYAMSQNKNKTTIFNVNKDVNKNDKTKNKNKSQNKSKNKIPTFKNKKIMEINTSKDNMEIDQSEEKKIPTQEITNQSKYNMVLNFYNQHWKTSTEYQDRNRIKDLLSDFVTLCPVNDKNELTKDIKEMSILDFNKLQSILLDYYNFSVLFTTKYSPFITLGKAHTESKTNKNIYNKYQRLRQMFYFFVRDISKYIKILNNFCYNLLFEDTFNKAIQDLYFNKIKTKKSTNNEELNGKTLEQLPKLTTNLQKIFQDTQTEITSTSKLWGHTFSEDKFKNNTFIDEDTAYNEFEVTPNITQNEKIPINLKDQIPHQYKINTYILAAVYKMELLKSQYYMKKLKNNHLKNENTENIFKSYDEAKKYANDIFKTYNSLRSFIVLDKGLSSINSDDQNKDDQDNTTALEIFKKDAKSFNEDLKKYTSEDTNNVYDLISFLICELSKGAGYHKDQKDLLKFISKSDFNNKYHIDSIPKLYNHISNNNESYNQLFGIYNVQDLIEFYSQINTNSNPNKENGYQGLNKFLGSDVIDILKNEEAKSKEPKKKKSKNEELKNNEPKNEELKNERSYTINLNANVATGLLKYYNRNWRLDKNQRKNILKRLEDFGGIYNNFNSKEKIQKNANLLNENFNSLQSILLDYYKFLLFFSKYNNLIKTITTRASKMRNYDRLKGLIERNVFVDNYKSFTDQIKGQVANIKKFVNEMLKEKFKDPKNTNITIPEANLTQLLTMSEEIQKLEPNFKKIFEIMKINKVTGNRILTAKTPLEDIDVIPKIDEIANDRLYLYSINAAPPHYRVNLDILATILKMEIVKWLPYFKKMQDTTVLNNKEKDTDINFTQSKKEMSDYINTIYQFYDKLKTYMVWSMNDMLLYIPNCMIYGDNQNIMDNPANTIHIYRIMGKEKDFMKEIEDYIKDINQFYTTFYLPPDESNDSPEDQPKKSSTKKDQSKETSTKKDPSKTSTNPLSANLFKIYYDRRQDCVDQKKSQITLFAKHILKKQKIYDNFMNNQDPNISDMKLLDLFFSRLDPGYFAILPKDNANTDNPSLPENENLLLKENKDNKKSIVKQLIIDTKLKRNNSNQNSLTYNNTSNHLPIFQKNNNNNIINDNLMSQRKKDEKHNKKTNKNSSMNQSKKDEKQNIQDNFFDLYETGFNRTATNQNLQNQFEQNEDQINNNITLINLENNFNSWDNLEFESTAINNFDKINYLNNYNITNLLNNTNQNDDWNIDLDEVYKDTTKKQDTQNQIPQFEDNLKRSENQINNNALNKQNIIISEAINNFGEINFIDNTHQNNLGHFELEDELYKDEKQPMQDNLPNLYATGFNSTTKQRQFNRNAKQVNNNALVENFNLDPLGLGHFINLPFEENNITDTNNNRRFKILNLNNARQNAVYKDTTKKQNTQIQIPRNALNQQNIMMSEDDKNRIDELLEIINNPNKQNTQNQITRNENFEDLTKRDKNKLQYDQYPFDENESDSEDSVPSGIVTHNLGGAKKRGGAKKTGGAKKIKGGTKIKIMLNSESEIESEESYNSDDSYHIGGTHNTKRKKGKKSKKTKPVLGRKTSRKNTKTPMKKHTPSKKKK